LFDQQGKVSISKAKAIAYLISSLGAIIAFLVIFLIYSASNLAGQLIVWTILFTALFGHTNPLLNGKRWLLTTSAISLVAATIYLFLSGIIHSSAADSLQSAIASTDAFRFSEIKAVPDLLFRVNAKYLRSSAFLLTHALPGPAISLIALGLALFLSGIRSHVKQLVFALLPNSVFERAAIFISSISCFAVMVREMVFTALLSGLLWGCTLWLLDYPLKLPLLGMSVFFLLIPFYGFWLTPVFILFNLAINPFDYTQFMGFSITLAILWLMRFLLFHEKWINTKHQPDKFLLFIMIIFGYIFHQAFGLFFLPLLATGFYLTSDVLLPTLAKSR
jgi:hypothetical protein